MPHYRVTFVATLEQPEKNLKAARGAAEEIAELIDEHIGPHASGDPLLGKTEVSVVMEYTPAPDDD